MFSPRAVGHHRIHLSADYVRRHFNPKRLEQIEHAPASQFHEVPRRPRLASRRFSSLAVLKHAKGRHLGPALDQLQGEIDFDLMVVGKPGAVI